VGLHRTTRVLQLHRSRSPSRVPLLTDDTDWEEIRELVTESYRVLAPKKLTALLD
jgi:hypothetical protein